MSLVTGGAGFFGNYLQAGLVDRGVETVVSDRLGYVNQTFSQAD